MAAERREERKVRLPGAVRATRARRRSSVECSQGRGGRGRRESAEGLVDAPDVGGSLRAE